MKNNLKRFSFVTLPYLNYNVTTQKDEMPKKYRLNDKKIIQACSAKGKRNFSDYFIIKYLSNDLEKKFAIVITKKFDKRATKRNRLRRQVRSAIIKNINSIKSGYYLIMLKNETAEVDFENLSSDLLKNFNRC